MNLRLILLRRRNVDRLLLVGTVLCLAVICLASCGGGGGGAFGNPSTIVNDPASVQGQKLSFAYFQRCIDPIFNAQLTIVQNGVTSVNSCAGSGCHDTVNGTGGALRVVPNATAVDIAANTPDVIRTTDMYRNYYSAQGMTIVGAPTQSRLINKPQVNGTLHGGGLIFESASDPNLKLMAYWISRPMPQGQDEFSSAADNMFTPADAATGTCNTE